MPKSTWMRREDCRALTRLVGECRDLGGDGRAWRDHLVAELVRLADADLGMVGEVAGCGASGPASHGVTQWGWRSGFIPMSVFGIEMGSLTDGRDPCASVVHDRERLVETAGSSQARADLLTGRSRYCTTEHEVTPRSDRFEHTLWCFRSMDETAGVEQAGTVLSRAEGRSDFDGRERLLVQEVMVALAPLIGRALARFDEPSARDLAPRAREVLSCLLEGDSDKEVATRLALSPFTVNEYVRRIYRHFRVRSRAELLARWIRRSR